MNRSAGIAALGILALLAVVVFAFWASPDSVPAPPPRTPQAAVSPRVEASRRILALRGATLIDGSGSEPLVDSTIVIQGERVLSVGPGLAVEIPSGAETIDVREKYVIPGLADMHNHLRNGMTMDWDMMRRNMRWLLGQGVTMVFNPAVDIEAFADLKVATGPEDSPRGRFFSTGLIFHPTSPGGADFSPRSAAEARENIATLKAAKVDAVKIFHDDGSWVGAKSPRVFPPEIVDAIVEEAHRQGLKVYVHAPLLPYAKEALRAGADGLLHSVISDPVDDEFLALMKKNQAVYIATMSLFESCGNFDAWVQRQGEYDDWGAQKPGRYEELLQSDARRRAMEAWTNTAYTRERLPILRANLKRVYEAGIPIVTGTDTGLLGVILGVSTHLELLLHVEAGIPTSAVLQAATLNAARMVGREADLGTVAPGKLADLVILDANPLEDIRNTRRIHRVMRGGNLHDPKGLMRD